MTVLAVATALAAAGCSGGSSGGTTAKAGSAGTSPAAPSPSPFVGDSARQVLAKAQDAADGATSVHLKGTIEEDGEEISVNLKLQFGKGAYGYVKLGGDTIQIRRVGTTTFMKAGDRFWKKSAPGSEKLFGGQWIKGNYKSKPFVGLNAFTTRQLVTEILKPDGKITRAAGKDVDGVPTVGLKGDDKSDPGVLYIATTGKAYPLLIESVAKPSSGSISLFEWDQPVTLTAPGGAIDIDKLAGASA